MPSRPIRDRAKEDLKDILHRKAIEKIGTAVVAAAIGGGLAFASGQKPLVAVLAALAGPLLLLLLAYLWCLVCAPYRVLKSRATEATGLAEQRKADLLRARTARDNALVQTEVSEQRRATAETALTAMTADRDGYKKNCEVMYEPQIAELLRTIEKYRAAENEALRLVRTESDRLSGMVSGVNLTIARAREGHSLQFTRFGLPGVLVSDGQWATVGQVLDLMWSEVAEYERIFGNWYPNRSLPGVLLRTKPDTSESLDAQRKRVEDAVTRVLDAITEIRERAETVFRAYLTMDNGLPKP